MWFDDERRFAGGGKGMRGRGWGRGPGGHGGPSGPGGPGGAGGIGGPGWRGGPWHKLREFLDERPPRADRGAVRYLVLDAVSETPRHGYEIMAAIEAKSQG